MEKLDKAWLQSSTINAESILAKEKETKAKEDFETLINGCNAKLRDAAAHGDYTLTVEVRVPKSVKIEQIEDHFGDLLQRVDQETDHRINWFLYFSWEKRSQ